MREADLSTFMCQMSWKSGRPNLLEPSGPVTGLLYLYLLLSHTYFSKFSSSSFSNPCASVFINMLFCYSRICQTRTYTRNVGVNTYTNVKNYMWDSDGQLSGVEAQGQWGFRNDTNRNLLSLTYK